MQTYRRLLGFVRHYRLFSFALLAIIIGLALELAGQRTAANWLLGVVSILELLPLVWSMWRDIQTGRYGIDILAATAILTSVILRQYWAAIVVVVMLTGGESLEDYAEHRAKRELDALLKRAPQKAHVLRKGKTIEVTVGELHVGDRLLIKAGELVPVDATIIEGAASFDESSLTGESLPQAKQVGDTLLSGSIDLDGAVTARATATAADSQYQQIVNLVQSAAASRAPFVRLADRYSLPFTLVSFAIASCVWILSGHAIRFLEVIVVATPCPLLLAAPIALISGMSRASRYGIIVRSGSALERLAEVKTMAFDKTGTLTSGQLEVDTIIAFGSHSKDNVLSVAAGLEQSSNHVLATAVVAAGRAKGIKPAKAKHIREVAGRGLSATIKGQEILVGRFSLLTEHGVEIPATFKRTAAKLKQTAIYVAIDGKLAGVITLKDEVRPESAATLEALRRLGIGEFIMVTGDNQAAAETIAKQLGIGHVHAEALPADKLHILDETQHRPLAFVGDGVNDAPILTAADLGIALGARGVAAASESADVVIMPDDLGRVAVATGVAKRTFQIARQSILVGIGLSLGLMAVFATGKFPPLAGAIIQEVVDVFVILNALRAHVGSIEDLIPD
ncbi:MAG TPA: heavy metal translocating P-type ATPase [Candidatus Saccharimonadales bacterium]|nr:heavy metal translocating P-type ATPase [Candidatus Saccharimonadales bacterium]